MRTARATERLAAMAEARELRAYLIHDSSAKAGVRAAPMPDDLRAKLSG